MALLFQDLEALLRAKGGKEIVEGYYHSYSIYEEAVLDDPDTEAPILSQTQRGKVVQIIVNYLLELTDKPPHELFSILADKVVEIFNSETVVRTSF